MLNNLINIVRKLKKLQILNKENLWQFYIYRNYISSFINSKWHRAKVDKNCTIGRKSNNKNYYFFINEYWFEGIKTNWYIPTIWYFWIRLDRLWLPQRIDE